MTISGISSQSALQVRTLIEMRRDFDDLQRQLGTGKKADTYSGFGLDRGLAIGLRMQRSGIESFVNSIEMIDTRTKLSQTALNDIDAATRVVNDALPSSSFVLDANGRTTHQVTAHGELDRILAALNTRFGDQYIFSGQSPEHAAVDTIDHILEGDGARAGFKQAMSERAQADLGAGGLGRLNIPAAVGTAVSVSEDVAGSPFGFKLSAASTSIAGATVTGPAGTPPEITVDLAGNQPSVGDTVSFTFDLPDGTSEVLTLTATTTSPPEKNEFTIGADASATAANLQTALTSSVGTLAQTALTAASAIAAADDFFNIDAATPPQRVNGPPFDTATALIAGTDADTVRWYTGEAGTIPARATATTRIDAAITVSHGMRANEEALRRPIADLAVFAAMTFSTSDPNGGDRYAALTDRLYANLNTKDGVQKISDMQVDIAGAQTAMAAANDRHTQTTAALDNYLYNVENVPAEQVGMQILALHTSMQASLQTTALLANLSLVNYL